MIGAILGLALLMQPPAPPSPPVQRASAVAPQPPKPPLLRNGLYVCTWLGGQPLEALGFRIIDAERYASTSGQVQGTYVIEGGRILFRGGHLDGEVGSDLIQSTFKLGGVERCYPR